MIAQLYINGLLCEVGADIKLNLIYQCADPSDLSTITANRSSTVSIPLTSTNVKALGFSYLPGSTSSIPYSPQPARLYVDGVPVFESGFARVASIENGQANINLYWSTFEKIKALQDSKVRSLPISESVRLNPNAPDLSLTYAEVALVDYGQLQQPLIVDTVDTSLRLHLERWAPVIKARPIVEALTPGVTWPASVLSHMSNLRIVTGTFLDDSIGTHSQAQKVELLTTGSSQLILVPLGASVHTSAPIAELTRTSDTLALVGDTLTGQRDYMITPAKGKHTLTGKLVINPAAGGTGDWVQVVTKIRASGESQDLSDASAAMTLLAYTDSGQRYWSGVAGVPVIINISLDFTVPADNSVIAVELYTTTNIPAGRTERPYAFNFSGQSTTFTIARTDNPGSTGYFGKWPVAANLPDITGAELVKSVMQIYGLMLASTPSGQVVAFSFDDLYSSVAAGTFKDWTGKLVRPDNSLDPRSVEFDMGIAASNYFTYAEDSAVDKNTGRGIVAGDYLHRAEAEIVKHDTFAPSLTSTVKTGSESVSVLECEQFEVDNKGSVKRSGKAKPRFGYSVPASVSLQAFNYYSLENHDLDYSAKTWAKRVIFVGETAGQGVSYQTDLIPAFFAGWKTAVTKGKYLKEQFMLTPSDLNAFDFRVPVYLRQYGRYFSVKKITLQVGGLAEVELIKL